MPTLRSTLLVSIDLMFPLIVVYSNSGC
ncbi:Hypothetical protein BAMTRB_048 [Escherichia phage vB_Eco_Bam]|uniref:Uncharacterized protein n=1 Tax=Escherichia phage vB_Eco_Bam TaxID=2898833 RepID=A0A9P0VB06_9CAUD|nr:Hypothetical protein BAMTRB_048 [Escherichia phage vB_Eco_Bam]